jgi:hypothetical protein
MHWGSSSLLGALFLPISAERSRGGASGKETVASATLVGDTLRDVAGRVPELSDHEAHLIQRLADGETASAIGEDLGIGEEGVKSRLDRSWSTMRPVRLIGSSWDVSGSPARAMGE